MDLLFLQQHCKQHLHLFTRIQNTIQGIEKMNNNIVILIIIISRSVGADLSKKIKIIIITST